MSDTKERLKQNGYVSSKKNDSIVDPFTNDVLKRLTILQKIQVKLIILNYKFYILVIIFFFLRLFL
jgi:hypothetical protein